MREYEIDYRGQKFRVLLSDTDARKRGLTPVEADVKARTVANKARPAANK